ncbi:MAG: HEAT repeat domain-containing protein [Chloroflexota bacterium]
MPADSQYIAKWVDYLRHADREMSRIAAQKLGATHDPQVIPELVKALQGRPDDVRTAAVRALGEIGHPDATPALVKLLDDNNVLIASAAAEALGVIGDARAVEPLTRVIAQYKRELTRHTQLHGFNRGLYMAAVYALEQIGTPEARRAISQYYR